MIKKIHLEIYKQVFKYETKLFYLIYAIRGGFCGFFHERGSKAILNHSLASYLRDDKSYECFLDDIVAKFEAQFLDLTGQLALRAVQSLFLGS